MDNIEIFDRIPTPTHPLEKHYMLPITQFLHQWIHDDTFYTDFVDFCPFNRELTLFSSSKIQFSSAEELGYTFSTFSNQLLSQGTFRLNI